MDESSGKNHPLITRTAQWDEHRVKTFLQKIQSLLFKKNGAADETDRTVNPPSLLAYPNCDMAIWLRSCELEILSPMEGITSGSIPHWISGSLYRNGPGKQRYDRQYVKHLFDAAGLLHKFNIQNGRVTYQCRFVQSSSYVRNCAAQQLVVPEFTTPAAPDPCKTIFHKISSLFVLDRVISDNAMISIYPVNDDLYAFAESPFIHRIDPVTLETTGRVNLRDTIGIINQSSHPHVIPSGAYNIGQMLGKKGPNYVVVHYPTKDDDSHQQEGPLTTPRGVVVARAPCRSLKEPSYMHSFCITESYYVLVEQPLCVRLQTVVWSLLTGKPIVHALKWRPKMATRFRLINRKTGVEESVQYLTEAFFFLHTINAFEVDNHVVIDICCYKDAKMLDCMYIEALKNAQENPDYSTLFRGRPKRFVLPLKPKTGVTSNLNSYELSASRARWVHRGSTSAVFIHPDELCSLGCETPRINYDLCNGRPYRYFYAISSDVDAENPGTLIKVDTIEKKCWTWAEPNLYASEPIFIPHPEAKSEDDGVVLSSLIWGKKGNECRAGLLVLDAATWTELGRTEFHTPGPVPKCLHGYFRRDDKQ